MPAQGLRSTKQSITDENRLVRVPDKDMAMLESKETALVTLMLKLGSKRSIKSPIIEHFEDDFLNHWVKNVGAIAASAAAVTITLIDGTGVVPGDIIMIPSGTTADNEQMRVTAKPSDNVCTVVRNIGNTGLLAIADGAGLLILGQAYEEGSGAPITKRTVPVNITNYLQIYKKSVNITGTDAASEHYADGGSERTRLRQKMLREFKISKNYSYLWGSPSQSLTGGPTGQPIRTNGGLFFHIKTNRMDAGGMLTQKEFETFSLASFRYGAKEKLLLVSGIVANAINHWGNNIMRLEPGGKVYGVDIQKLRTAHGVWNVTNDWSLVNGVSGQAGVGGYCFSVDMERIEERYLTGRDTTVELNVEPNDEDRDLDLVTAESGLQVHNEKCHAVMIGVTDYEA